MADLSIQAALAGVGIQAAANCLTGGVAADVSVRMEAAPQQPHLPQQQLQVR